MFEGRVADQFACSVCPEDQETSSGLLTNHMTEQVECGGVRPLKVIKRQHERSGAGKPGQEHSDGLKEPQASLFGGQGIAGRPFSQHQGRFRQARRTHRCRWPGCLAQVCGWSRADVAAERFEKGLIGGHAFSLEGTSTEYERSDLFSTSCDFLKQTRLANPWFACHQDDVQATGSGLLKLAPQAGLFVLSSPEA